MRRTHVLIGLVAIVTALLLADTANATVTTRWVSPAAVGANKSCGSPGYNSINAAVAASSPGNVIKVCAGTYNEQVVINVGVTVTGLPGATIAPPNPNFTGPLVLAGSFSGSSVLTGVKVQNLTIDGQNAAGTAGSGRAADGPAGIRFENASGTISGNLVENVNDASCFGCQFGISILAHTHGGATATVHITGNTIQNFQKGAIVADAGATTDNAAAGAGLTGNVTNNTVTGIGPTTLTAQNGIQISRGAHVSVISNTVSGTSYTGTGDSGATAAGILLYDAANGVLVKNNTVSVFDIGIDNEATDPSVGQSAVITQNTVDGNRSNPSDTPLGCSTIFRGIDSNDAKVTISLNTVAGMQMDPSLQGCQTGVGIRTGVFESDGVFPTGTRVVATILRNNVSQFQKAGIVVNGDQNRGILRQNTVTGWGNSSALAQNLIQFAFGATGAVGTSLDSDANHIDNFGGYTGNQHGSLAGDSAAGVLIYEPGGLVTIRHNVFQETPGLQTGVPDAPGSTTGIPGGYAVVLESDHPALNFPNIPAQNNDWGRYTSSGIAQLIWDANDDATDNLGIVVFTPFLGP